MTAASPVAVTGKAGLAQSDGRVGDERRGESVPGGVAAVRVRATVQAGGRTGAAAR